MRVLVTGAAGFIGYNLCNALKKDGFWVRGVDWKEPEFGEPATDEHYWDCDLRYWYNAKSSVFGDVDHVYALAADMGGMGFISTNHYNIIRNNSLINLNTANAAKQNGVKKLFYSSSACVYPVQLQSSTDSDALKEDDAWMGSPEDGYGVEKLFSEQVYLRLARESGVQTRIARFHNIYGPYGTFRGGREKLPAAACRKVAEAKDGDTVEVWGDGLATRSFCYIDDCVKMIRALMDSDYDEPMNIGSDRSISVNGVYDIVARHAGTNVVK